jgi:hypothetical protein
MINSLTTANYRCRCGSAGVTSMPQLAHPRVTRGNTQKHALSYSLVTSGSNSPTKINKTLTPANSRTLFYTWPLGVLPQLPLPPYLPRRYYSRYRAHIGNQCAVGSGTRERRDGVNP